MSRRGLDPRTPVDDWDRIARDLKALRKDVAALKAPSGTARFRSVEKLTKLVTDIQAELDAYNADRYTNAQIDEKIADPAEVHVHGPLTVDGAFTSGGVADTAITVGSWATMVVRTDAEGKGQIGYNTSTERTKNVLGDLDLDPAALAEALRPVRFHYIGDEAETPRVGLIAERVATVLPEAVVLDADGEPLTIDYTLTGVAALALLVDVVERLDRLEGNA